MNMKIGRREFDITNNDVVLHNGVAYILMTKKVTVGKWGSGSPSISRTQATKLIKDNILVEFKKEYMGINGKDEPIYYTWYRFNMED